MARSQKIIPDTIHDSSTEEHFSTFAEEKFKQVFQKVPFALKLPNNIKLFFIFCQKKFSKGNYSFQ